MAQDLNGAVTALTQGAGTPLCHPVWTTYPVSIAVLGQNWLPYIGSKELGDQGYTPIEILRYFYGSDMYINTAEEWCRNYHVPYRRKED